MDETTISTQVSGFNLSPKICLIVDDDQPVRSYVKSVLKVEGHETVEAARSSKLSDCSKG